jgi:hypothetical protein
MYIWRVAGCLNGADSFGDVISDPMNNATFIRTALDQLENAKETGV